MIKELFNELLESANQALQHAPGKRELRTTLLPVAIQSDEEHVQIIELAGKLIKQTDLLPAGDELLDLPATSIEHYENKIYQPFERLEPYKTLQFLIEEHDLQPKDLIDVFGAENHVLDAVSGKRAISGEEAEKLAERFCVSVELFE